MSSLSSACRNAFALVLGTVGFFIVPVFTAIALSLFNSGFLAGVAIGVPTAFTVRVVRAGVRLGAGVLALVEERVEGVEGTLVFLEDMSDDSEKLEPSAKP